MALTTGNLKAVNLGCGISVASGWINIDNSPNARLSRYPLLRWLLWKVGLLSSEHYQIAWPKSIRIHSLTKKLPFSDSSIDYIYSSHALEHLSRTDAQKLIVEVGRVLKPEGILRIVVPDLSIGARRYVSALENNVLDPNAAPEFLDWLQLSRANVRSPHLWMYDAASLGTLLSESGFVNVEVCEYQKGRMPDCDILDNRPDESLYVEAQLPGSRESAQPNQEPTRA
jgi:predicted SAM-dependent methyltransferase